MINFRKFDKVQLFKSKVAKVIWGIVGTIVIALIINAIHKSGNKPIQNVEANVKEIKITPTSEVISTDELWRGEMQDAAKRQEEALNKKISSLREVVSQVEEKAENSEAIKVLNDQIKLLANEVSTLRQNANASLAIKEVPAQRNKNITQYTLNLENARNSEHYKSIKTVDNYIPSGSYAKATLLSALDANTSLKAASDPEPVLIRIRDYGTLPRRFKSDLKDCHVIAAAYGHLSSERVKMRLETLSCVEIATGEIIETEVVGFVSGGDGKLGIRGKVVSTEGRLIGNAFLSGALSGLANNFNSNTAKTPTTLVIDKFDTPSVKDRLEDSLASGSSSGLDKLSKYYIERAESLQPVIGIQAGTNVNVIFTKGVFFGTSEVKKAMAKKRDEVIRDKSESANASLIQPVN